MSILETHGLTRTFGGIRATWNVNFSLEQGELRCLIGPNGAGKSTLFKLIIGLLHAESGSIHFMGRDVTRLQPFQRVRRGMSMKYQTTRVYQELSVAQNVAIARSAARSDRLLMDWSLEYFGLNRELERPVKLLSYGEQHWLEMCMVLGTGPKLVLMDEPTAGMTPEETHHTADYVKKLNGKGMTLIIVGHDMGFVREIAQRVTVMHEGSILREGQFSNIEQDPEVQRVYLGERHE